MNPFIGWPIADYVRDGAALFCLFATLGMPWHIEADYKGGEQWWVVISVLLSVLSLAVPYVAKARVVPAWGPDHFRLLKLGLNVPFLASVLAALIDELINVGELAEGGFGVGIAMGLAGCALAVQPRQADEDPAHADDPLWNNAARFAAIAAPAVGVLAFLGYIVDDVAGDGVLFDEALGFVAVFLVTVVMMLVVVGWPAVGLFGGSPAWRRVFATASFTVLVVGLFALASDGDGLFTWPRVREVERRRRHRRHVRARRRRRARCLASAGAPDQRCRCPRSTAGCVRRGPRSWCPPPAPAVAALALLVGIVNSDEVEASAIVATLMVVVIGAAAGVATTMLSDPGRNRVVVLALLGAEVVVGFIAMGIINGEEVALGPVRLPDAELVGATALTFPITGWVVAAWVCLPALAAYSLTVPPEVRAALGPLVQQQRLPGRTRARHPQGYPQQGYPQAYPPAQPPGQPAARAAGVDTHPVARPRRGAENYRFVVQTNSCYWCYQCGYGDRARRTDTLPLEIRSCVPPACAPRSPPP